MTTGHGTNYVGNYGYALEASDTVRVTNIEVIHVSFYSSTAVICLNIFDGIYTDKFKRSVVAYVQSINQ